MIDWSRYAELSRRLDAELRDDAVWRTEARERLNDVREGLDGFVERLDAQRDRLLAIAREAGTPPPDLSGEATGRAGDLAATATAAWAAMDRADEAAARAAWWAGRPLLLPGMSVPGRATVVYGVTAVVAFLLSFTLFAVEASRSDLALSDLLPAIAALPLGSYAVGRLVLLTAGRPRRPDSDTPTSPPALGLVISYGVMIAGWVLFVAIVASVT